MLIAGIGIGLVILLLVGLAVRRELRTLEGLKDSERFWGEEEL